jgi:hypothetical protein
VQITPVCTAAFSRVWGSVGARTAGLCAFYLVFSITRRDAVCRRNLLPAESSRYSVAGLEVAAGDEVPDDAAHEQPAAD